MGNEKLEKVQNMDCKAKLIMGSYEETEVDDVETLSDLNVFSFWKEEILRLYATGRSPPKEGIFRRALQRSNLVEFRRDRCIWSEYGVALIEEELGSRGVVVEQHRSLHWKQRRT
jgi:hypothetical protein